MKQALVKSLDASLNKSIKTALAWSFFEKFFNQGFSLLVKLYLARLLLPEAYGLIGMAAVFIAFLSIMGEQGLSSALIQRDKSRLDARHWNTAFTVSLTVSIVTWVLILLLFGSLVSRFFDEPQLKNILIVLGLMLVGNSLSVIQRARLAKDLKFKVLSFASIVAVVISSIVALVMAYLGFGVWSLVAKALLNSFVLVFVILIVTRWLPRVSFSKSAFLDLFGFSGYTTIERFLFFLTFNIDIILIGRLLGKSLLGACSLALTLTEIFRQHISGAVKTVFFPAYSKLQNDKEMALSYLLKEIRYSAVIIIPAVFILSLDAQPIIVGFFGDSWQEAANPLKILALATAIRTSGGSTTALIRGFGYAKLSLIIAAVSMLLVGVPGISIGVLLIGIEGAAWGIVLHRTIERLLNLYWICRIFRVGLAPFIEALSPCALICLAIAGIHAPLLYFMSDSLQSLLVRLVAEALICGALSFALLPAFRDVIVKSLMLKRRMTK